MLLSGCGNKVSLVIVVWERNVVYILYFLHYLLLGGWLIDYWSRLVYISM